MEYIDRLEKQYPDANGVTLFDENNVYKIVIWHDCWESKPVIALSKGKDDDLINELYDAIVEAYGLYFDYSNADFTNIDDYREKRFYLKSLCNVSKWNMISKDIPNKLYRMIV